MAQQGLPPSLTSESKPPGQPSSAAKAANIPQPIVAYRVLDGETLWSIASRRDIYGDSLLWPLIYKANRDQIKDPRQIYPGQTLNIPRDVSEAEKEEAREKARKSDLFHPVPATNGSPGIPR